MTYFLRRIFWVYFSPYRKQCFLLFLCILAVIVFDILFPLGTKYLIDLAIIPRDGRMFALLLIGLAGIYLIASAGSLGLEYLNAWVLARVLNDIRLKMFSHLQALPASYYTHLQHGDILTLFNADLVAIEYALPVSVVAGIQSVLQLILSLVVLFILNVKLGALTTLLLPLTAVLPKLLAERASALVSERRVQEAGINTAVEDNLQAQAVNRIFGLRGLSMAAFSRQLNRFAKVSTQSDFAGWAVNRATDIGQYLIQLLVIAIGAYLVFTGKLSIGSLVGSTSLLISVGYSVSLVSAAFAGLIPAATSLKRIERLLDEKVQVVENPDVPLPRFSKEIRFDQVTFSYAGPGEKPNLNQINLSIPCGQSVALVGRSGSGKSTILNLLMRFYDPNTGRILLDGQDIQQVSLDSLRLQMGVVFQDTFLFNISLRENIRLGKPGASDAEVEEAARAAGVHETIMRLPAGYDTLAGEQGKMLSGGQRQRIAIARAMIRRPAILLLDEATSALDPETELRIHDTLQQLGRTCTALLVTHRLALAVDVDQIVVMDQGQVAETGTHADLMRRQGIYHHLYEQQSGFTVSSDGQYAEVTPARLRSLPLFEKLDDATLEELAAQFVTERYDAGYTVIQEGEAADKFYIVVRGKLSVTVAGSAQQPAPIEDGGYFGEIALLEAGRRTATVRTQLPCLLLSLERKHFLNMMARFPDIRAAVEQTASARRLSLEPWAKK